MCLKHPLKMSAFKLMKYPIRSSIRTNKTKSLSEIYKWDFEIQKIATPKIVLLNNMTLNPEYTYENYYKRHLEALPPQTDLNRDESPAGERLAGEPKRSESLSVLDIRTKPEVLEKWVSVPTPNGQRARREWLKFSAVSKNCDA